MEIVLQGTPKRKAKFNIAEKVIFVMFALLPILLLLGAVIMFIIHAFRLNENIIVAFFEVIGDIFKTRVGWFFADNATFASVYENNALEYTFRMALSAIVLFLGYFIIERQCPYCGHFFTQTRISGNKYEGSTEREVSNTYYDYSDAVTIGSKGSTYYTGIRTQHRQYGTEETEHYTYNVRCSYCGCVAKKSTSKSHTRWN